MKWRNKFLFDINWKKICLLAKNDQMIIFSCKTCSIPLKLLNLVLKHNQILEHSILNKDLTENDQLILDLLKV